MKLVLGTVQFGLDYGISNRTGKTPAAEVKRMLELAARAGVRGLDTAPAYAVSEEVVGQTLPRPHAFEVITKTVKGETQVAASLERSLQRLGESSVDTLLVHDGDALSKPTGAELFASLRAVKDAGRAKKIGTIVYDGAQLDAVLERFPVDVVQVPISLLDQRLLKSGHLDRLVDRGVEVHARSVFLQGLLLLDPAGLSTHFDPVRSHLVRLRAAAGSAMLASALQFVLGLPQVSRVVVGATSVTELEQIIAAAKDGKALERPADWAWSDERILNPALWPAQR